METNTETRPGMIITAMHDPTQYTPATATVMVTLPSGRETRIDCYGPRTDYGDRQVPSSVNWAGIGSVDVADVAYFAQALAVAADVADGLWAFGEA